MIEKYTELYANWYKAHPKTGTIIVILCMYTWYYPFKTLQLLGEHLINFWYELVDETYTLYQNLKNLYKGDFNE